MSRSSWTEARPWPGRFSTTRRRGDRLREGKGFYVNFGTLDTQKHGKVGTMTDEEIGHLVVREFEAARLRVSWNGDINQAILVEPGEPEPKTSWERLAG